MNVRIDYQPSAPQPRRPAPGSSGKARKRKAKDVKLFGAVGVGVLAVIVAAVTVGGKGSNEGHPASPAASASAAASAGTGGMEKGTATAAGSDGSRRVAGMPWGFPHTTAGAVEAATTVLASNYTMERLTPASRAAWLTAAFGKVPAGTEDRAKLYQSQNSLNSAGQLIDPATGQVSTDTRFTDLCHPELGAYRLVDTAADAVTVDVWQPCISGDIGASGSAPLTANWSVGEVSVTWKGGAWLVTHVGSGSFTTAPTPGNPGQAVTTYAERAKILAAYGTGWTLYADASETAPAELGNAQ